MATEISEVSIPDAAGVLSAAVAAAGPAPDGDRSEWLARVRDLVPVMQETVKDVRIQMMRVVKRISVTGVLSVPRQQNNAHRINYEVDSGGKYRDTLWTAWFDDLEELAAERKRLESFAGRTVQLMKVTTVDFLPDGSMKQNDRGGADMRSEAEGGVITLVEDDGPARPPDRAPAPGLGAADLPVDETPVDVAKRTLVEQGIQVGMDRAEAIERARKLFGDLEVVGGMVRTTDLRRVKARMVLGDAVATQERLAVSD